MTTPTTLEASARHLLSAEGFSRVVHLVQRDNEGIDLALAERITDEAIKFVAAAATATGRHLRPSKAVDMGWHALILHTAMYRGLCASLGRFVDHRPEGPETLRRDADTLDHAMDAIRGPGTSRTPICGGHWRTRRSTPGTACTASARRAGRLALPRRWPDSSRSPTVDYVPRGRGCCERRGRRAGTGSVD